MFISLLYSAIVKLCRGRVKRLSGRETEYFLMKPTFFRLIKYRVWIHCTFALAKLRRRADVWPYRSRAQLTIDNWELIIFWLAHGKARNPSASQGPIRKGKKLSIFNFARRNNYQLRRSAFSSSLQGIMKTSFPSALASSVGCQLSIIN